MDGKENEDVFRVVYCGMKTMGAFIYVIRSLRIYYAYKVHDNMRSHRVFKFFKNEFNLVVIVGTLIILRIIPPLIWP
jgi:hypothetical protein